MSSLLTRILEDVRLEYVRLMQESDGLHPYLSAERLCHERLFIEPDTLARIVSEDPTLLAARAGSLVMNKQERENPSVGVIICSNILAASLEGLLTVAVEHDWLEVDEDGALLVDEEEMSQDNQYPISTDYSHSATARSNLTKPGQSQLSAIFNAAEDAFLASLQECSRDAYQKALTLSSDYAVFAPDDLAPLIAENPLLLGLRPDGLIDEDMFDGDPPAGLIISTHLTRMLLHQLLELAVSEGVLSTDEHGHVIVPDSSDTPTLH
ncbi:hypothetical protein [Marinobacterium arenosum]|uniref:hypothetical protein n=1 Tax=Marinobacterium arenosum TaxID=2862496 RepID=UPI001C9567DC|nr:hypothetical protein [Marinobacterium arenosum]MBY4678443.1 hypothetical protein [Marinobacterium arenosum]